MVTYTGEARMDLNGSPAPHDASEVDRESFLAAESALRAIDHALRSARAARDEPSDPPATAGPERALAALPLLRELRERLDGWEHGLIESARDAGASWADLASPLGVASRQAAERRYLRLRPADADPGATGDQRVKTERDRRAAERAISRWARVNASELRRLAGRIGSLDDLPGPARTSLGVLVRALADDDAALLLAPLIDTTPHLKARYPELAAQTQALADHTERLRRASDHHRRNLR